VETRIWKERDKARVNSTGLRKLTRGSADPSIDGGGRPTRFEFPTAERAQSDEHHRKAKTKNEGSLWPQKSKSLFGGG